MKSNKWIAWVIALALMGVAAGFLQKLQGSQGLSQPGVRVVDQPLLDPDGKILAPHSIELPKDLPDARGTNMSVTETELTTLPADTTFGRRLYIGPDIDTQVSVVLMGRDRASIHQPQYCMVAQGWTIDHTDYPKVPMTRPRPYQLPVACLTMSRVLPDGESARGLFIYWFVSKDKMVAQESNRMLSMAKTALTKGELERWAYVSYFAACKPGLEKATFDNLVKLIQESAPQFLLVAGESDGRWTSLRAAQ